MRKHFIIFVGIIILSFSVEAQSGLTDTIRVGIRTEAPFIIYDEAEDDYYGLSIDLWEQIAEREGLIFEYVFYPDMLGLIRALDYNELDITINPIPINSTRLRMFEASQPFFISSIGLSTQKVRRSKFGEFVYNFFSLQLLRVVLLLLLTIFIFGTLLWFAERKRNRHQFRPGIQGVLDGIWWSAVTMTTVGYGDKAPKSIAGRAIAIIWMFTGLFIMAGFIASITSTLTLTHFKANIETLDDLSALNSIGAVTHSTSKEFLERNELQIDQDFETVQKGMQSLINDDIDVLVFDRTTMRYVIDENNYNNRVVLLPAKFNSQYKTFLFPENSPLIDRINPVLVDILNDPIWEKMMKQYNLYLNE